jgi:hypothetical protein
MRLCLTTAISKLSSEERYGFSGWRFKSHVGAGPVPPAAGPASPGDALQDAMVAGECMVPKCIVEQNDGWIFRCSRCGHSLSRCGHSLPCLCSGDDALEAVAEHRGAMPGTGGGGGGGEALAGSGAGVGGSKKSLCKPHHVSAADMIATEARVDGAPCQLACERVFLYTGHKKRRVALNANSIEWFDFLSSSLSLKVSIAPNFLGTRGTLWQIMPDDVECADVSWISKFPGEREVLFNPCNLTVVSQPELISGSELRSRAGPGAPCSATDAIVVTCRARNTVLTQFEA